MKANSRTTSLSATVKSGRRTLEIVIGRPGRSGIFEVIRQRNLMNGRVIRLMNADKADIAAYLRDEGIEPDAALMGILTAEREAELPEPMTWHR